MVMERLENNMEIGILGVGNMGGAILNGIVSNGLYKKEDILLYIHSLDKLNQYKELGYNVTNDVEDLYKDTKIILLGIKPQMFEEVLKDSHKYDFKDRCIITIAAGLTIKYVSKFFKNGYVVRCMPNTPAKIGRGVTTVCANDITNPFFKTTLDIFNSIGVALEIEENKMDESLPLNGSMPAYLFYFAKCFIDKAVKEGIDYEVAKNLCLETIKSSADLVLASNDSIDTLISNVCSKGGTTIAGLNQLYDNGFDIAIDKCSEACTKRSKELCK